MKIVPERISEEESNCICSEERKLKWMHETRIRILMQMELEAYSYECK